MDNSDKPSQQAEQSAPAATEADGLHEPRGSFNLTGVSKKKTNKTTLFVVIGAVTLVLVLLVILWSAVFYAWDNEPNAVDETQVKADPGLSASSTEDDPMAAYKAAVAKKEQEDREREARDKKRREAAEEEARRRAPPPPSSSSGSSSAGQPAEVVKSPKDRKLASGVVVTVTTMAGSSYGASSTGRSRDSGGGPAAAGGAPEDNDMPLSGGGSSSRSRGSLSGLSSTPAVASKAFLAPDGKYLLRNNTYSRCALYTEVITEHESRLSCYLVSPLYSSDGSTLIADAGARMTGEQKIEMKPGQAQVFTQWNDLEVESGQPGVPNVRVRFDALGTGPMGSSGTKGWIDNKYLDRYGGAIVLTATKDVLQMISNTTQRSNGSGGYTINNSEQNVEDMATKTLDANININPVGYLLPGTVVNVTIARDIDFSSVYENR